MAEPYFTSPLTHDPVLSRKRMLSYVRYYGTMAYRDPNRNDFARAGYLGALQCLRVSEARAAKFDLTVAELRKNAAYRAYVKCVGMLVRERQIHALVVNAAELAKSQTVQEAE